MITQSKQTPELSKLLSSFASKRLSRADKAVKRRTWNTHVVTLHSSIDCSKRRTWNTHVVTLHSSIDCSNHVHQHVSKV